MVFPMGINNKIHAKFLDLILKFTLNETKLLGNVNEEYRIGNDREWKIYLALGNFTKNYYVKLYNFTKSELQFRIYWGSDITIE